MYRGTSRKDLRKEADQPYWTQCRPTPISRKQRDFRKGAVVPHKKDSLRKKGAYTTLENMTSIRPTEGREGKREEVTRATGDYATID